MNKLVFLLLMAAFFGCSNESKTDSILELSHQQFSPVLTTKVETISDWPNCELEYANEIFDYFDMAAIGGSQSRIAKRRLEQLGLELKMHALLLVIENERVDFLRRRQAYSFLFQHSENTNMRFFPRLILRLKYEKDWPSNIIIASTLAKHGNLSGLDAVMSILQTEQSSTISDLELARSLAAKLISNLNGDNPNFEENWQNLLAIRQAWNTDGSAPVPQHESLSDESYLHELWHTAAKLQSQPLRPVDDARFVFIRLGNPAMEVLAEVAMDEHRYVRDHALQTFNWMSRQHNHISNSDLILLGRDYYTSVRSIEYRGSLRSPTQSEYLWPFIWHGNYEQRTAAADSLLRCSDTDATNINQLDFSTGFSPEAQCSLSLLRDELNGNEIVEPQIQGLDKNELARRMRWRLSRD